MQESYYSITQLNNYIKNIMESDVLLSGISIYGEVASYTVSKNIAYFSLKDENNLINCVMFNAGKFKQPLIGDLILAYGNVNYYGKMGKLSLNVVSIEPYGKGALYEKFLQLKEKLQNKGYFDQLRKRPIPRFCKNIGVVSSETGAVIQDIRNVSRRRNDGINIILYPVKVQGVGAEFEIAQGIDYFSNAKNVDVIIVARGGGSLEELQPFNTEVVADATYNSSIPVVSAVGHETDFTIIDFVSDLRAPTPSAAAELVVWDKNEIKSNVFNILERCYNACDGYLNGYKLDVKNKFSTLSNIACNKIKNKFINIKSTFLNINLIYETRVNKMEHEIELINEKINGLNPERIYKMGYVKAFKEGKLVKSANKLKAFDNVEIEFLDGKVKAEVKE